VATYFRDADGDGYGDPKVSTTTCVPPTGYVKNNLDCNDKNSKSGICPPASTPGPCGNGTTVMCRNGVQECIKNNEVKAHEKDGWKKGSCTSGQRLMITGVQQSFNNAVAMAAYRPKSFLLSNFPNPFSSTTRIRFEVPVTGKVSVIIYNSMGQAVAKVFEGIKDPGSYAVDFDGSKLGAGVYQCKLASADVLTVITQKLMIVR
jgi:hypothetical protein